MHRVVVPRLSVFESRFRVLLVAGVIFPRSGRAVAIPARTAHPVCRSRLFAIGHEVLPARHHAVLVRDHPRAAGKIDRRDRRIAGWEDRYRRHSRILLALCTNVINFPTMLRPFRVLCVLNFAAFAVKNRLNRKVRRVSSPHVSKGPAIIHKPQLTQTSYHRRQRVGSRKRSATNARMAPDRLRLPARPVSGGSAALFAANALLRRPRTQLCPGGGCASDKSVARNGLLGAQVASSGKVELFRK